MHRRPGRAQPSGPGQKSWTGFESPVSRCPGRGRPTSSLDPTPRKRASRWRLSNRNVRRTRPPRVGDMFRKTRLLPVGNMCRKPLPPRVGDMGRTSLSLGDMGRTTSLSRVTDLGCWTLNRFLSGSIEWSAVSNRPSWRPNRIPTGGPMLCSFSVDCSGHREDLDVPVSFSLRGSTFA
jgi:hypothetical protein